MREDELAGDEQLQGSESVTAQPTKLREGKLHAETMHESIPSPSIPQSQSAGTEHTALEDGFKVASAAQQQDEQTLSDLAAGAEAGPIERLHLLTLLKDMTNRLGALEATLSKPRRAEGNPRGKFFLEFLKILLGGWPAFGFIFLIIFYFPLRDALLAIPDRVRSADEIQLPGVSLKSTIKKVAVSQGLEGLGETIPKLASPAIELLLRAPRNGESLVSFTNANDGTNFSAINFPSESVMNALSELQGKGLIKLQGGLDKNEPLDGAQLKQLWGKVKERFPGSAEPSSGNGRISWTLKEPRPIAIDARPRLMWTLTDVGSQAVDVILKAISTQLLQTEDPKGK
jgi:hypothetical protein